MALFTFKLPDIGEGIAQAEIVGWHVKVGDRVEEDQPIADMMTDKATVEMESPVAGTVVRLAGEEGDQVSIGSMLVEIEVEGEDVAAPPPSVEAIEAEVPGEAVIEEPTSIRPAIEPGAGAEPVERPSRTEGEAASPAAEPKASTSLSPDGSGHEASSPILASPAVRARAKDLGIDLAQVKSAGDHIRHADLDAYLLYGQGQGYRAAGKSARRPDEQVKVIGMRRRIAENMAASKRHIPHFTYVEEIDVTALEALREQLNASRGDKPKLTMLPLLIVAICKTLPDFPMLNARYDDEAGVVTRHGSVHLGLATQTDAGLMVPVIRDVDRKSLWELAEEVIAMAGAARDRKLKPADMQGGCFTVSSLGSIGGRGFTPIINTPEVGILGVGRAGVQPVWDGSAFQPRTLLPLGLSYDHRVINGGDAGRFMETLLGLLGDIRRLLL